MRIYQIQQFSGTHISVTAIFKLVCEYGICSVTGDGNKIHNSCRKTLTG